MKFDVGHIIESSIIEATSGKCIGALNHPSTITRFCHMTGVRSLEFEEICSSIIALLMPKLKKTPCTSQPNDESNEEESEEEGKPNTSTTPIELEELDTKEGTSFKNPL